MHRTVRSLERYSLEFVTIPPRKNGSRQDKTIIFPNYLTTASVRWIKQKATRAPGRIAEKTCEKLMILIEKSKILKKQLYCVGDYKALTEIVEKIYKAEKTCEKLMVMMLIEKTKLLE